MRSRCELVFAAQKDVGDVGSGGISREVMPSINWCGSPSISNRSLKVPGSISSALATRYFGCGASFPGNKGPLQPRWETGAAAASQVRMSSPLRMTASGVMPSQRLAQRLIAASPLVGIAVQAASVGSHVSGERFLQVAIHLYRSRIRSIFSGSRSRCSVVVDHHDRRMVARAEADDRKQRETPVGGGFAGLDAKPFGSMAARCSVNP